MAFEAIQRALPAMQEVGFEADLVSRLRLLPKTTSALAYGSMKSSSRRCSIWSVVSRRKATPSRCQSTT